MNNSVTKSSFKIIFIAILLTTSFSSIAQDNFGGLALYTVRDAMKENAKATLQAVADAGYKYVEAASYSDGKFYNMTPTDFKAFVDEIGLTPLSTHQSNISLENIDAMIADVKAAGFTYFVIPSPPKGFTGQDSLTNVKVIANMENFVKLLNTVGEKCSKAGLQLLYHNHNYEFIKDENGQVPYDYFLEHTNPEYVNFQMDLFWVVKADVDPIAYFNKYQGRFKSWHVKDMDDEGRFAPVGTGHMNLAEILANKTLAGMDFYLVEQDKTFNMDPLDAIKVSHEGLKTIGFN